VVWWFMVAAIEAYMETSAQALTAMRCAQLLVLPQLRHPATNCCSSWAGDERRRHVATLILSSSLPHLMTYFQSFL
jgi:hypothetical protein